MDVYIEGLTDNKNPTAAEVRFAFNKNWGGPGESGCVTFMFERKGFFVIETRGDEKGEQITLNAIEAGAEDVVEHPGFVEVLTEPEAYHDVMEALMNKDITPLESEIAMVPNVKTFLTEEEAEEVLSLVEALEDNDDVQSVYHNLEIL
ncbi:YebC/PmpR family DNA-binding transcriptional regulator [Alteribacter salitolerans]|uniref:YebC/PmpR family DNA-binding transcriptional regulator n=1 Tax=Alteribacter salitolerans TaxID=2912333 RepID=UPI0030140ECA